MIRIVRLPLFFLICFLSRSAVDAQMRITEYMYSGTNGEFVEFTNVGTMPVDMTGYSFDDNNRTPGAVSLSGFGTVQPGESVILAETDAATFRNAWTLCSNIKVIGNSAAGLGRNDEINLYDALNAQADRLSYSDQDIAGSIRTQNRSGWVSALGLGNNSIYSWTLSTVGDGEGSYASTDGDIGSPGKSARATVAYNPCAVVAGAPTIEINVATTTDYLDGGATTPPGSPYAISGVINDVTDPAYLSGINFTIADDLTPVGNLTVTVTSSNTAVVPIANLTLSGIGSSRNLKINPAAVGYSNITITVNDGTNSTLFVLNYAASANSSSAVRWSTGIADASAAIALDDNYMVIGNDESNFLYVFDRNNSGLPVKSYDYNAGNSLNLTDGSAGLWKEIDAEAVARSTINAARTYWIGSMSNSSSFNDKPNRNRLFAVDITGTGSATSFTQVGYYAGLRQQLISWGDANGYNFTASAAEGVDPKNNDGFNIEGMVFGPDNTSLYIGFRAPLVPMAARTKAVIASILNFESWFNSGSPSTLPTIGAPIELDLGGRGIRDIIRLTNNTYVIIAGSSGDASIPAIFRWTGLATDAPLLLPTFDVSGLNVEAVLPVNQAGALVLDQLQIICDDGNHVYYGDGIAAKDLPQANYKKFTSEVVTSSLAVLPVRFEYFTAARKNGDVELTWKNSDMNSVISFDIMRSQNGLDYTRIKTVEADSIQHTYSLMDVNAPSERLYYQIRAKHAADQSFYSSIRIINPVDEKEFVNVYPNPVTNGSFRITANKQGIKEVSIYNSTGSLYKKLVFAKSGQDIQTASWPKGQYLLHIVNADGSTVTKKIIVQ